MFGKKQPWKQLCLYLLINLLRGGGMGYVNIMPRSRKLVNRLENMLIGMEVIRWCKQ